MSANQDKPARETKEQHWTDGITEALDVDYRGSRLKASGLPVVAGFTLASFVGLAHYNAPQYAYLIASGTGVIFGLLTRQKRWRKPTKSG